MPGRSICERKRRAARCAGLAAGMSIFATSRSGSWPSGPIRSRGRARPWSSTTRPVRVRTHALWALIGMSRLPTEFNARYLACGRRSSHVGRARRAQVAHRGGVQDIGRGIVRGSLAEVRLQVAIAAGKLSSLDTVDGVDAPTAVLARSGHDPLFCDFCRICIPRSTPDPSNFSRRSGATTVTRRRAWP